MGNLEIKQANSCDEASKLKIIKNTWRSMISRCSKERKNGKDRTYAECKVCEEWLVFGNFKEWMDSQDWQGKQIDKDILIPGNKIYSPSTCVFVDHRTNSFLTDRRSKRGEWPIGVCFDKHSGKFRAHCGNPFTSKSEKIGRYLDPQEAHLAWKKRKHEFACMLADMQTDERVSSALKLRYA